MKWGFTKTNNRNKYQWKAKVQEQNRHLDYLIDSSFRGVKRLFILSFENNTGRVSYKRYYLSRVEIKNYNVMTDGRNVFDQPVKKLF